MVQGNENYTPKNTDGDTTLDDGLVENIQRYADELFASGAVFSTV
jgi:hypothetical protein